MGNATHFFLGANSGLGFQNLFGRFCEEYYYDLLVLKGGPGVGKSTMMKKIGAAMEERGEQVEYLHCSGDPDSLDGICVPRIKTAVVDGTSPHIVEPKYPAAVGRYINLGQFYDIAAAKNARMEIVSYSDACGEAYQRAYHALAAARNLEDSRIKLLRDGFDYEKLMRRTEGIIAREIKGRGSGKKDHYRFLESITCKGNIFRYDTVEVLCPRIYHICDSAGFASPMLERIHGAMRGRGYGAIVCPNADRMDEIQHLLCPELGVAFVTVKDCLESLRTPYRRLHLDDMVSRSHYKLWKGRLKFLRKMAATLREDGVSALRDAKVAHDELEGIYRPGVDFPGIDKLTADEIERIANYE